MKILDIAIAGKKTIAALSKKYIAKMVIYLNLY
jgi:hypothetical protein